MKRGSCRTAALRQGAALKGCLPRRRAGCPIATSHVFSCQTLYLNTSQASQVYKLRPGQAARRRAASLRAAPQCWAKGITPMAAPSAAPETLLEKARRLGVEKEFTVTSCVCPVKLKEVIERGLLRPHEKAALKELAKVALRADGAYEVNLTEKRTECGRAYSKNYARASAITMRGAVRGVLLGGMWTEVDIEACHPSILSSFALMRDMEEHVPGLTEYLANRKEWLQGVAKAFRCSEADAKQCFNAAIYGERRKAVLGADGERRPIHEPWGSDGSEESRARLSSYIREVQALCERLLDDPVIRAEHRKNLRRREKPSSNLFRLLEARPGPVPRGRSVGEVLRAHWRTHSKQVGERLAIRSLMLAIENTHGEVIPGEVIYDGMLVRLEAGGPPKSWDLKALCNDASKRASELFGMNVTFKAKPLVDGDIFPEGRDGAGTTAVMEDKGGVTYCAHALEHAPKALERCPPRRQEGAPLRAGAAERGWAALHGMG